ncbi:hypothetical protein QFC20_002682 [Naganishia adeliensis]|uniref:Uncharacterized protein n=1 Tax=Naganishia adeliensis TaxID=92952 RepID=A0ACC2WHG5_9TREE|nr:hypothetical protein QFC20_002682 [Naganishia adeliensis]
MAQQLQKLLEKAHEAELEVERLRERDLKSKPGVEDLVAHAEEIRENMLLQYQIQTLTGEIVELKQQCKELQDVIAVKVKDVVKFQKTVHSLDNKCKVLEKAGGEATLVNEEFQKRLDLFNLKLESVSKERDGIQEGLAATKASFENEQATSSSLLKDLVSARDAQVKVGKELKTAESRLKQDEAATESLRARVTVAEDRGDRLDEDASGFAYLFSEVGRSPTARCDYQQSLWQPQTDAGQAQQPLSSKYLIHCASIPFMTLLSLSKDVAPGGLQPTYLVHIAFCQRHVQSFALDRSVRREEQSPIII